MITTVIVLSAFISLIFGGIISCVNNPVVSTIGGFMFLYGIIGCILSIISIVIITPNIPVECEFSYKYNIYSIEDTASIYGRKYYVEEQDKYVYIADYKDGRKKFSIPSANSYIIEQEGVQPHIQVLVSKPISKNKFINWLYKDRCNYNDNIQRVEYKIVVPPKTVTTEFNIDLKK